MKFLFIFLTVLTVASCQFVLQDDVYYRAFGLPAVSAADPVSYLYSPAPTVWSFPAPTVWSSPAPSVWSSPAPTVWSSRVVTVPLRKGDDEGNHGKLETRKEEISKKFALILSEVEELKKQVFNIENPNMNEVKSQSNLNDPRTCKILIYEELLAAYESNKQNIIKTAKNEGRRKPIKTAKRMNKKVPCTASKCNNQTTLSKTK